MSGLMRGERQLHLLSTLTVFCSHQSRMKGREINMGDNKAVYSGMLYKGYWTGKQES